MTTEKKKKYSNLIVNLTIIGFLIVTWIGIFGYETFKKIDYNNSYKRPIEYSVSDSSPQAMAKGLQKGLDYLKKHNLDDKDTCVFVYSPMCDVSQFSRKLTESIASLEKVYNADDLTRSNVMRTVRTTFVTTNSEGEKIGFPNGVTKMVFYGNNKYTAWVLFHLAKFYFWIPLVFGFILLTGLSNS